MRSFSRFVSEELSFEFHDELNSKFWKNEEMIGKVREQLLLISDKWAKFADIPRGAIKDIVLVGGNANYNYTKFSDLDVHLVVDYSKVVECEEEFVGEYLRDKKSIWEFTHDITIYGVPVEVFAEPMGRPMKKSQGVFSLRQNKWLQKPKKEKIDPKNDDFVQSKVDHDIHMINYALKHHADDEGTLKKLKKRLQVERGVGIRRAGEYSVENLVFKELRNRGYIDKMKKHIVQIQDRKLSLKK